MSTPLRILCVFASLDRGGAESMCMNIYRSIDRSIIQFDFVKHNHNKGDFEDEIISLGGRIYEAPAYVVTNHMSYCRWWSNHLQKHSEHRIIHGHFFTIAPIYFKVAKRFGCKTIAHSHCTWDPSHMTIARRIKKHILKHIEDYSDFCFACSHEAGAWLYPKKEFKIINNAIDTNLFTFSENKADLIRKKLGMGRELVIGHVGNIMRVKNHSFILDVFYYVNKALPCSKLVLVGNGSQNELRQKAVSLGIDKNVIFTGPRRDVADLLQAFDVFVFPSFSEGLPVTVVEAQASGLRCFLSDTITREVDLTGRCEFLPIDDPKLWAERVMAADLTKADTSDQIKAAGYDIHTTAEWLQNFYVGIAG